MFSEAQSREMWTPQTLLPSRPRRRASSWRRGISVRMRSAGCSATIAGRRSCRMPAACRAGHAVRARAGEARCVRVVHERGGAGGAVVDAVPAARSLFGIEEPGLDQAVNETFKERLEKAKEQLAAGNEEGKAEQGAKGPSLALEKYAGRYRDAWYGTVTIERDGDGMNIRFDHTPSMTGKLEHVRYDTFRTRWSDRNIEDAYVTFALNPDGSIERCRCARFRRWRTSATTIRTCCWCRSRAERHEYGKRRSPPDRPSVYIYMSGPKPAGQISPRSAIALFVSASDRSSGAMG